MRITLLIFFMYAFHFIDAQQSTPHIISNSGDHFSNANISVSWTLGEPVIETFSGGSITLTQGFHQTRLTVSSLIPDVEIQANIKVWPNPANSFVFISSDKKHIHYRIVDISGRTVMKGTTENYEDEIDFSCFSGGIYFMEINHEKTFKIIKQ